MATRLTLRLDFPAGQRVGPGKIALLQGVARHGSIAAAGRELGMSYRRAWLLVDELNRMFAAPIVATKPGGKSGGGAWLTDHGERLIALYRAMEATLRQRSGNELGEIEAMLADRDPT
ncbi:MAG: winged helix-turn-helix domain-containing protein [Beijerinckiaceae bacterium]|nr:winged helix-turn-helix domain-containing protein [Beijerinckiaceae bacterium]